MIRKLTAIPTEHEKEAQKRCGYGCIVCGAPLFTYNIIEEGGSPSTTRPDLNKVILLCIRHQKELDQGDLSVEEVRMASKNPFNRRTGNVISPVYDLSFSGERVEIEWGVLTQVNEVHDFDTLITSILVDEMSIFGTMISQNHFLMNILMFDEYNVKIIHIRHNAILSIGDKTDVIFEERTLKIIDKGETLLKLEYQSPNRIMVHSAKFKINGVYIEIHNGGLFINKKRIESKPSKIASPLGLVIGGMSGRFADENCFQRIKYINRYCS